MLSGEETRVHIPDQYYYHSIHHQRPPFRVPLSLPKAETLPFPLLGGRRRFVLQTWRDGVCEGLLMPVVPFRMMRGIGVVGGGLVVVVVVEPSVFGDLADFRARA